MQLSDNKKTCRLLSGQFKQGQRNTSGFNKLKGKFKQTLIVFCEQTVYFGLKWPVAHTEDRTCFPVENLFKNCSYKVCRELFAALSPRSDPSYGNDPQVCKRGSAGESMFVSFSCV